jgi:hypothetical protein
MKRSVERLLLDASDLSPSELYALRNVCVESLDTLYAEKAFPFAERFFREGVEVFLTHILGPLSLSEPFTALMALRLVNRHWRDQMRQIKHLNISQSGCSASVCRKILDHHFPSVISLRSHVNILNLRCEALPRITHLEIEPSKSFDIGAYRHIFLWTGLTTLIMPSVCHPIQAVSCLLSLTHLEIELRAFGCAYAISLLVNLRHLWIRFFPPDIDLSPMKALRYLNSDSAYHFLHFTGSGVLSVDDDMKDASMEIYQEGGFMNPRLRGEWVEGVFTGDAEFLYGRNCEYRGGFVGGRRGGYGQERDYENDRTYKGEWRNGLRHGMGKLYGCEGYVASLISEGSWRYGEFVG